MLGLSVNPAATFDLDAVPSRAAYTVVAVTIPPALAWNVPTFRLVVAVINPVIDADAPTILPTVMIWSSD